MTNKKICLLIDSWFPVHGGAQVHVMETSKILINDFGCEIDLYVRALKDENGEEFKNNEILYGGKMKIYRIGPCANYFNPLARLIWLIITPILVIKNNFKRKYNLIHAHAFLPGIPAKIINFFTRTPIIYTVHGTSIGLNKNSWQEKIEKWLITGIKYDQEISVSRNFLEFKNVNKDIVIIPNGVNVEDFDKVEVEKSDKFKVLYVGRFDKIKGVDLLIKAIDKIKNEADFEVHLIGYGYEEKKLKELVKDLKLENKIIFRGKMTGLDLIKEYKSSHLFVLPSLSEGQPLTLLEAWAAKLPVIATRVGDNEFFINKDNGYLISPKNEKELSEFILKAMKDKNLEKLGLNGYGLVKEKYTWKKTAQQTIKVYKKCS